MGDSSEGEQIEHDKSYSPASENETEQRQERPASSGALADGEIDADQVGLLPGTGGPDDVGDVEVDEQDLNLSGEPLPREPGRGEAGRD